MNRLRFICIAMAVLAGCAPPRSAGPATGAPAGPGQVIGVDAHRATNASSLIVTPSGAVSGRVTLVNPKARYVVVTYPIGALPPLGQRLPVYHNGLKVGEIRISGPQRDVNTVGDIVAGECRVGDEVRPE